MSGVLCVLLGSGGLIVSVSPPSVVGSDAPGVVVSGVATATSLPAGASFTWSYVSGDTQIEVVNVNGASTAFRATVGSGESFEAVWRVTGTLNGQTVTADVSVTIAGV